MSVAKRGKAKRKKASALERLKAMPPGRTGPLGWIAKNPRAEKFVRDAVAENHAGELGVGKETLTKFLKSEFGSPLSRQAVSEWIENNIEGGWNGPG